MIGNLTKKFKVLHSIRPKLSLISKKRIKLERDSTPQRWSRRIRSLPPIPFDVLRPSRKIKKIKSEPPNKRDNLVKNSKSGPKKKIRKKSSLEKPNFFQKRGTIYDNESFEITRIIPVVVYVKKNKARLRSLSDVDIQIKDRSSNRLSNNINSVGCQDLLREESSDLEKKWSQRFKSMPFFLRQNTNKKE